MKSKKRKQRWIHAVELGGTILPPIGALPTPPGLPVPSQFEVPVDRDWQGRAEFIAADEIRTVRLLFPDIAHKLAFWNWHRLARNVCAGGGFGNPREVAKVYRHFKAESFAKGCLLGAALTPDGRGWCVIKLWNAMEKEGVRRACSDERAWFFDRYARWQARITSCASGCAAFQRFQ
jgi:hypothetical protein